MNKIFFPQSKFNDKPLMLGVLGGGQLGRMFAHAAQALGYETLVLDPDYSSPAGRVAHHFLCADYDDKNALQEMAARCMAVTTEFENVPAASLEFLASKRFVCPAAKNVAIAQNRILEKSHFSKIANESGGIKCAPYLAIESKDDLIAARDLPLFPAILKTARMGYDGKGQASIKSFEELAPAWTLMGHVPCVLEKRLDLDYECSVIIARGADGQIVNLPVQLNIHKDGILAATKVFDGNMPLEIKQRAISSTFTIANALDYVGVLCVEYFVLKDGEIIVNEIAPRPHNSGHYTVDACDLSQFDLQVRTLTNLPLPQPQQHSAAIMLNLLGDIWFDKKGNPIQVPWDKLLSISGAHLHLYGKLEARHGRKMGHLTLTSNSAEQVQENARQAAQILGLEAI